MHRHGDARFACKAAWVLLTSLSHVALHSRLHNLFCGSSAFASVLGVDISICSPSPLLSFHNWHIFIVPWKRFPPSSLTHVQTYQQQHQAPPPLSAHSSSQAVIHTCHLLMQLREKLGVLGLMQSISPLMQTQQKCNKNEIARRPQWRLSSQYY